MAAESNPHQQVIGWIGCPGAGKTTYARRYDPLDGWVHLTLDDLRTTLWPPHRQIYWRVRNTEYDVAARQVLHRTKEFTLDAALCNGLSVVMADTHLSFDVFAPEREIVARHGIRIAWKVFDISWDCLLARNEARARQNPSHRQPESVLRLAYDAFRAPDAWWRNLPEDQIEFIDCNRPSDM